MGRLRLSYAPYFAGWCLTWPIIAYMGGQGFSGLIGFLALPVLLFVRPKSVPPYTLAFAGFLAWAVFSSTWSPAGGPLITGSFSDGTFAVSAAGLRVGLTGLAIAAVIMALRSVAPGTGIKSLALVRGISLAQGAGVIVTALFMGAILALLAPFSDPRAEMPQNLLRNANSFLLLLPFLMAWAWHEDKLWLNVAAVLSVPVFIVALVRTGSEAAVIAMILMLVFMGVVYAFKRFGLAALFVGLGVYMLAAPILVRATIWLARLIDIPLPLSFWSRIHAWQTVTDKVAAEPLIGHGLQASETWRDTFGDKPEQLAQIIADSGETWVWSIYPIIPRHPHNMPLQVWAETGIIGAGLAALAFFCLAFRFRRADDWSPISRYAGGGLIGVAMTYYSFSYSMWNEAFWASVAIAVGIIILHARQVAVK